MSCAGDSYATTAVFGKLNKRRFAEWPPVAGDSLELDHHNCGLHFYSAELSEASAALLVRKLEQLGHEFADFAKLDRDLPVRKKKSVALLTAFRPWVFSMFDGVQRAKRG
jgi:hypothetical protein